MRLLAKHGYVEQVPPYLGAEAINAYMASENSRGDTPFHFMVWHHYSPSGLDAVLQVLGNAAPQILKVNTEQFIVLLRKVVSQEYESHDSLKEYGVALFMIGKLASYVSLEKLYQVLTIEPGDGLGSVYSKLKACFPDHPLKLCVDMLGAENEAEFSEALRKSITFQCEFSDAQKGALVDKYIALVLARKQARNCCFTYVLCFAGENEPAKIAAANRFKRIVSKDEGPRCIKISDPTLSMLQTLCCTEPTVEQECKQSFGARK